MRRAIRWKTGCGPELVRALSDIFEVIKLMSLGSVLLIPTSEP
jgi:hypothetical protein